MQKFTEGLEKIYADLDNLDDLKSKLHLEDLNLQRSVTEDAVRPDFAMQDWILAGVYDHIDKNILGFDWDFSDAEIVNDLMGQFRQIKTMIERRYESAQKYSTQQTEEDTEERPRVTLTPPGIPQDDIGGEGTFIVAGDTLIVNIDDVEDRIDGLEFKNLTTGETQTSMIRIRAQLERLLRKMGYDVEAPNKRGKYEVRIYWHDKTGEEIDRFKLVRKSRM